MALDPEAKKIMTETMTKATAIFATATTLMGLSLLTGLLAVNHEKTTLKGKEERLVSEKETALLKDEKSVSSQEKTVSKDNTLTLLTLMLMHKALMLRP